LARVVVLIVVLVVLALGAGVVLLARALGLDSAWLARGRHALGEARYRTAAIAAELADFIRMGR
jgi:hypothetical protein